MEPDGLPAGGPALELEAGTLLGRYRIGGRRCCGARGGIVHRDLKPGNIMIAERGLVKVLDFGLAMQVVRPGQSHQAATATETGHIVGTVDYMSPEQAEGKSVDARSDIFSFGTTLYEMLTDFLNRSNVETAMPAARSRWAWGAVVAASILGVVATAAVFHSARRSPRAFGNAGDLTGLSIARDTMILALAEFTGSIWVEETQR